MADCTRWLLASRMWLAKDTSSAGCMKSAADMSWAGRTMTVASRNLAVNMNLVDCMKSYRQCWFAWRVESTQRMTATEAQLRSLC